MKEASGELNMTLVTIIAVGIIGAIFYALWPTIKDTISNTWTNTSDNGQAEYEAARQQ